MRDIAREAGTSAVTVSKALGGQPGMSDETRNRILQIAQQMGYEYPGGERPAQKQSLDIGILIPDRYFEVESFYALLYKELVKKLADQGHFGVLELLKAAVRMETCEGDRPCITMSMGRMGLISRIAGSFTGSAVTFATAGRASAPGQIPAREMAGILRALDGGDL